MEQFSHSADEAFASLGATMTSYAIGADGRCMPSASITLAENVQFACFDRSANWLYVVCSDGGVGTPGSRHWLLAVRILRQTGSLILENSLPLPHRPIHVSLDEDRCRLLVSFNRPAALALVSVDERGDLVGIQKLIQEPELVGVFPHQAIPVPGSSLVLLTCRGDDASEAQPERPGSLRFLDADVDTARCARVVAPNGGFGFGPRNCAFHPSERWMYAVLERQNELAMFNRASVGSVAEEPACRLSTMAPGKPPGRPQLAGAICMHPSGRYLYVANRAHGLRPHGSDHVFAGGENSVAVFAIDEGAGWPELIQSAPIVGLHPRAMDLNRDGTVLLVATRQGGLHATDQGLMEELASLCCFSVGLDGCLTLMSSTAVGPSNDQLFWCGFSGFRCERQDAR